MDAKRRGPVGDWHRRRVATAPQVNSLLMTGRPYKGCASMVKFSIKSFRTEPNPSLGRTTLSR